MGKYIYTYIENGQMYDKSPSLAELLAKEGLSCEKIVTGRIGYIRVENLFEKIKDARWLVFTSKNAVAGFAYNIDRKSTRLNSSHKHRSRMPSSA